MIDRYESVTSVETVYRDIKTRSKRHKMSSKGKEKQRKEKKREQDGMVREGDKYTHSEKSKGR